MTKADASTADARRKRSTPACGIDTSHGGSRGRTRRAGAAADPSAPCVIRVAGASRITSAGGAPWSSRAAPWPARFPSASSAARSGAAPPFPSAARSAARPRPPGTSMECMRAAGCAASPPTGPAGPCQCKRPAPWPPRRANEGGGPGDPFQRARSGRAPPIVLALAVRDRRPPAAQAGATADAGVGQPAQSRTEPARPAREAIRLTPHRAHNREQALTCINDDDLVNVTRTVIRPRANACSPPTSDPKRKSSAAGSVPPRPRTRGTGRRSPARPPFSVFNCQRATRRPSRLRHASQVCRHPVAGVSSRLG